MRDQHYKGLIAEWYDDWLKAVTADRDYYLAFFNRFQGQVLELGLWHREVVDTYCGIGRYHPRIGFLTGHA